MFCNKVKPEVTIITLNPLCTERLHRKRILLPASRPFVSRPGNLTKSCSLYFVITFKRFQLRGTDSPRSFNGARCTWTFFSSKSRSALIRALRALSRSTYNTYKSVRHNFFDILVRRPRGSSSSSFNNPCFRTGKSFRMQVARRRQGVARISSSSQITD